MLFFLPLLALLVISPATASPIRHKSRAGAPIPKSIDNCTVTSIDPSWSGWGLGYKPSDAFSDAYGLYRYYLNEEYQLQYSEQILLENCMEACHGLGYTNTCQSVFLSYNTPNYGNVTLPDDVEQQVGCFMFSRPFTGSDFVKPVVNGTYTSPKSVNLLC